MPYTVKNLSKGTKLIPCSAPGARAIYARVDPGQTRTDLNFDPDHVVIAAWEAAHEIEITPNKTQRDLTKAQEAAASAAAAAVQRDAEAAAAAAIAAASASTKGGRGAAGQQPTLPA